MSFIDNPIRTAREQDMATALMILLAKALKELPAAKRDAIQTTDVEIRELTKTLDLPIKVLKATNPEWNVVRYKAVLTKPPADESPRQRRHIDLT